MANTFSTTYPEKFSKHLLMNFDKETVMGGLVNRDYEGDIKENGDTVNAVLYGDVTISTYVPGSDSSVQALALTNSQLLIDQMKDFNFLIDKTEIQYSHLNLIDGWLKRSAVAMANTVDDRLLSHYADAPGGNTRGSVGSPITLTAANVYSEFTAMRKVLNAAGVSQKGRVAVVDEDTEMLLLNSSEMTHATSAGDEVIKSGRIGNIAGFDVYMTPRIATVSSTKNLMFFTKDAISLAVAIPKDYVKMYDPPKQHGTGVKGLALYGTKAFNPSALGVLVRAV